jgi:hypothetical protein
MTAIPAITREDAVAQLWKRGCLSWKLRPEQEKLLTLLEQAPTDLAVFNISRRLGKSTTCVTYCASEAIRRKQHIRYATAFLTDLEAFILPIFEWLLADCPDHLRPVWKASKKEFRFPNGSVIKLIGLDKNPNGLRGNAIDILIIDEAAFVSNLAYLYRAIIIPATMKRKFKLIFPSTPPESPEHFWASELVNKAKERNTYVEMTIDDISDLPPEERKRLLDEVGGEQSATAQREFFCKIIVDTNRSICSTFKPQHVQPVQAAHVKWMLFGDAGGVKDKTVFLEVGYSHDLARVLFKDELSFNPGTPTSTIVEAVKAKWADITLVLDAPGQLLIDYSSLGLPASLPAKDDFAAGLLLLATTFLADQAQVDPRCSLLIRTLQGGLLNKHRSDYERSDALGHCDAVAAAVYALRCVDKTTDLRPKPNRESVFSLPKDPDHIAHLKNLAARR